MKPIKFPGQNVIYGEGKPVLIQTSAAIINAINSAIIGATERWDELSKE